MKDLVFGVSDGSYAKGGATVQEVALYNEYGTKNIPPRPAFRRGLDHSLEANKKMIRAQLQNITQQILTGRKVSIDRSLTNMLRTIGRSAVAKTKEIIRSGDETPNAPSTAKRKKKNHPLLNTGLLLEHVAYEVV